MHFGISRQNKHTTGLEGNYQPFTYLIALLK